MKYTYELIYPNGERELSDDIFDSEEDAEYAAQYDCSCFSTGEEILAMMGDRDDEIVEGSCDYEIIELDE